MTQETARERIYREALDEINNLAIDVAMDFEETGIDSVDCGKIMDIANKAFFAETNQQPVTTDKLSVEKLQEELESCIQTLISVSILASGDENIVIGNFVDSRLSKLAKTHENVTNYIEKVTGKNINVILAENEALEALEGEDNEI
ncbi:hypothetical protein OGZ51_09510 [Lactococcus lactis]|uniref:Uncharacterized protein n=1 Tax=Lactococcus lactis TaxID=1358 RepID=A0A9X4S8Y5_9LACT|nr:hypothetical protein [Lactococcus lactis]MDG4984379.1 hypothetical protein [Lactococcus lactis]